MSGKLREFRFVTHRILLASIRRVPKPTRWDIRDSREDERNVDVPEPYIAGKWLVVTLTSTRPFLIPVMAGDSIYIDLDVIERAQASRPGDATKENE